jgi:hypothetical protein
LLAQRSSVRTRFALLASLFAVTVAAGCSSGDPGGGREPRKSVSPERGSAAPGSAADAPVVHLNAVHPEKLPVYRTADVTLPSRIPGDGDGLPSVLEHPPGRAVMAVRTNITQPNIGVDDWSAIRILLYGADGEWRRLDLGELGLEDAAIYQDTYGAGRLSPDGRWWMGPMHDGVVLVDLSTGEARQQPVRVGGVATAAWIPGTNSIAVNGVRIDLATGKVDRTPYRFAGAVGFEPDGTPLFVDAGPDGKAILYEWREGEKVVRVLLPQIQPPPRRGLTLGVSATESLVAVPQHGTVVVDSSTGATVGKMRHPRGTLIDTAHWIDAQTMLVARSPQFLAWRPATGKMYRIADARRLGDSWELDVALLH